MKKLKKYWVYIAIAVVLAIIVWLNWDNIFSSTGTNTDSTGTTTDSTTTTDNSGGGVNITTLGAGTNSPAAAATQNILNSFENIGTNSNF